MTITTHIAELRKSCESIDSSEPVVVPSAMSPGDMLPQGDIGLLMLPGLPGACRPCDWPEGDLQLAPGTSRGSRHCIPSRYRNTVSIYRIDDGDRMSDTVLEATAPFDLTHPEHADHIGYPPGIYRVRHQQTAQRERVLD